MWDNSHGLKEENSKKSFAVHQNQKLFDAIYLFREDSAMRMGHFLRSKLVESSLCFYISIQNTFCQ